MVIRQHIGRRDLFKVGADAADDPEVLLADPTPLPRVARHAWA